MYSAAVAPRLSRRHALRVTTCLLATVRYKAPPVPIGGRVRMRAELLKARGVPGGGVRLSFVVRFELEGFAEPACVAQVHYAYFP